MWSDDKSSEGPTGRLQKVLGDSKRVWWGEEEYESLHALGLWSTGGPLFCPPPPFSQSHRPPAKEGDFSQDLSGRQRRGFSAPNPADQ